MPNYCAAGTVLGRAKDPGGRYFRTVIESAERSVPCTSNCEYAYTPSTLAYYSGK